ncbi:hypothetical protein [Burkholderia sp. SIMBA_062]|uniref:hypothetical protein n=1 Tax=Burkholderia sp. SIMBA_062 TaxID=3085803 RepID=UPI003979F8E4
MAFVDRDPPLRNRFGDHERQHVPAMARHHAQWKIRQPVQAVLALRFERAFGRFQDARKPSGRSAIS